MTTPRGPVNISRPNIGLKRIHRSVPSNIADATRAVRDAMDDIMYNLRKTVEALEVASEDALLYALQPIYDESQVLVPVDTGALKESGYLEVKRQGSTITAEVGYARGGNPYYAAIVHEDLEAHHKEPTRAKYLQIAVDNNMSQIQGRYLDYMKKAVPL